MTDTLGDYMKQLEGEEAGRRAVVGKPLIARLDGRAFHTFTKGLTRPFDERLTLLMQETTQFLVEQTNALIGYTQSDEITLIWYLPEVSRRRGTDEPAPQASQYLFDGRYQKMCSILSAMATGYFNKNLPGLIPEKLLSLPLFDARVWQVPKLSDARLALLWRENDAIKNSISMVAQSHFSSSALEGVSGEKKKQMLREIGDPWEAYPSYCRRGSYFKRVSETVPLDAETLAKIPEQFRDANKMITRRPVKMIELPLIGEVSEEILFAQGGS